VTDYYFISDQHLPTEPDEKHRAAMTLFERLNRRPDSRLVILGDFFHFWFNRTLFRERYYRDVLEALTALVQGGMEIDFFVGNHDFLFRSWKDLPPGFRIHPTGRILGLGSQRYYVTHGDDLCRADWGHRAVRPIIRSKAVEALADRLPDSCLERIAHALSSSSRQITRRQPQRLFKVSLPFCRKIVERYSLEGIVHGHIHQNSLRVLDVAGRETMLLCVGPWEQEPYPVWKWEGAAGQWGLIAAHEV